MTRPFDLSLYLVTDPQIGRGRDLIGAVQAAVRGGASMVQLRDKTANDEVFVETGRALKQALAGSSVPLIVNDRLDLVEAIGADGLHIGQSDADAASARGRLGPKPLLGLSIETLAQTEGLDAALIDYVGAGPVFGTPSKADHAAPIGFAGLAAIVAACPVPVVAIGGLAAGHAPEVRRAGAAGLAVISAILAADDPQVAAQHIRRAFEGAGQ